MSIDLIQNLIFLRNFSQASKRLLSFRFWTALKTNKLQWREKFVARGRGLQIYYLLSCAGVWLGQHYYAIGTVIIYKSH